jgi:sugar lactone lactonase YvrE
LLGEGPYYEESLERLRFVDIRKQQIHSVCITDPSSLVTVQLEEPVAVTANISGCDPSEKILVALKYGIAILDRKTDEIKYIASFTSSKDERVRSNDGAVDPSGRFWIGTMTDFGLGEIRTEGKHDQPTSHGIPVEQSMFNSSCIVFLTSYQDHCFDLAEKKQLRRFCQISRSPIQ